MTAAQITNRLYRKQCLEYSKDASRCYGYYYISGNKSRKSGYEDCKIRDTCPWYLYREEGWNEVYVVFGSVKDFRRCNHKQLDIIKLNKAQ